MHYLSQPIDPNDVTRIAVELKSLMLPEIKGIIKEFQESQPDLKALVDGTVKTLTEAFQKETSALKKENASLRKENKNLRKAVSQLEKKVSKVDIAADSNEQYSRRNNLRISGISDTENGNTDEIVLEVANKAGVNIQLSDINRSHRVGPIRGGKRAILVKFTSYRARQQLFAIRKDLRKIDHCRIVYINEDLTVRRSKLFGAGQEIESSLFLRRQDFHER